MDDETPTEPEAIPAGSSEDAPAQDTPTTLMTDLGHESVFRGAGEPPATGAAETTERLTEAGDGQE